ncbi:UDP-N-acetylenolpyruvoylglucosamine reductase [Candidatus Kaiserbacteria bacterium RIFCSPHIGHO2_01_FULL_50_13]|uniref:UDP-N-acetylenolpyruvoylglucosamine reductase n=1 Tax=Candidatus Kaiserbacteria bacterium RIFCSPLOWO2_01_FULL_50_24 TaxID=1798507 RepID=A0A1F6EMQ0_9BACT|nr:MAG: UDP-N-acetylenolpyruvoylglucosamine reductase [Candidatus Kaiserbacteria bacterium RIFCSPHIGHO2_01_FULL_50_13]OGG74907.1 MAG: UDP-N-acetylenolpyruvoylglucosamine reductase [Candidatus Kaiserbacteria bacterium RIFCSPLOWO2_01_FULL_50_24]OGG82105.1 MAG: UDP-N-acetylenolpyruvoylglucosamine reductase [Candidatus Kaiserbacteria bacterium RIFCSPLOWO2_02_FULL_51_13]HXK38530.1 UDP-N-acetylmuramate dehydrogenase [Candidatus Paceibacterota bacterium]
MTLHIQENVPLGVLTTFKIGGPARYFVNVRNEEEHREALLWARERNVRFVILAGKSNVLIPDEGINGLVIHIVGSAFSFDGDTLTADAGCNLLMLIREAGKHGLGGWEKLAGIPGSIGGAVRGNAGAFGPEIKDFVVKVEALNSLTQQVALVENNDCTFAYRQSFFKQHPEWIILCAWIKLSPVEPEESMRIIEETIAEREKRHIQNVQAAGSYFMNPVASREIQKMFEKEKGVQSREGRVPAGWLIEKTGLKGARVGDASASEQHPNYIKNYGSATAKDVLALAQKIKDAVQEKFGVELKEEAVVL